MATKTIQITIEEGTTIVIDGKAYSGAVDVDEKTAALLIRTKKGK